MSGGWGRGSWRLSTAMAPATVWNPRMHEREPAACAGSDSLRRSNCIAIDQRWSSSDALPTHAKDDEIAFAPVTKAFGVDRDEADYVGAADEDLSGAAEAIQPKLNCVITLTRGACAGAGARGGQGDCGGEVSRAAAWDSVGSEGFAGYGGDSRRRGARSRIAIVCRRRMRR